MRIVFSLTGVYCIVFNRRVFACRRLLSLAEFFLLRGVYRPKAKIFTIRKVTGTPSTAASR